MQSEKITELLHQYFELGVVEGREGRNHDTEAGDAQRVLSEIEAEIAALSAAEREIPYHCDVCTVPGHGDAPCSPLCDRSAPSVAVKSLHQAATDFMHLFIQDGHLTVQDLEDTDLIPAYEKLSAALSAQVQDVAEYEYRLVTKEGREYARLNATTDEEAQAINDNNFAGRLKVERRVVPEWEAVAAPAKQDGGHD